jgi:protein-S-isoprenylcysteine O-methyltransferase Ste14
MKLKLILKCAGYACAVAAILFVSSGNPGWVAAWAFVAVMAALAASSVLMLATKDPELLAERSAFHKNTKAWDKVLAPMVALVGPAATWIVAGLDERYAWSRPVPTTVYATGFVLIVLGSAVILWAMMSNRFFSTVVRIQDDRGHSVACAGPYQHVRHPGYVGMIAYFLGTPLALGSWYALAPALLTIGATVLRTSLEDRTLLAELPGYREYASRVRYRLVLGMW